MHKCDEGIEQLHHDGPGVRTVQALNVEILLLHLLVLHTSYFGLQALEVLLNVQQPLLTLVLHLLLHVGNARFDILNLVLMQFRQIVDLLFQARVTFPLFVKLEGQGWKIYNIELGSTFIQV